MSDEIDDQDDGEGIDDGYDDDDDGVSIDDGGGTHPPTPDHHFGMIDRKWGKQMLKTLGEVF